MTRRFLYIVLAVLALQFSWSAVSAYCMHESGRAIQHFGHHQHAQVRGGTPANGKGKADIGKKYAHVHCSSCSHGALAMLALDTPRQPEGAHFGPGAVMVRFSSIHAVPPERPQWASAI